MSEIKLTEYTPIEQLFEFCKNNPDLIGGMFTQEYFFDKLTINDYDKFWVFEKLLTNNILINEHITLDDSPTYHINTGVAKVFKWMLQK